LVLHGSFVAPGSQLDLQIDFMKSSIKILLPSAEKPRVRWGQLYGSALALKLAEAAQQLDAPLLVIASTARELNRLEDELRVFLPAAFDLLAFPGWETLPYDLFAPHPDLVSQRLSTLSRLPTLQRGVIAIDVETAMQRLAPRNYIDAHAFDIAIGNKLDLKTFRIQLASAGYANASQVMTPGEFAVRGSLLDLFPMGSPAPYRIDLFDDEVETIRTFDVDSQRTLDRVECIKLLPAREFPLSSEGVQYFKRRFRTRFEGDLSRVALYKDVGEGVAPAGIEYYLPLFFEQASNIFAYLPAQTMVAYSAELSDQLAASWQDITARYEQRAHDTERPILTPQELFLSPEDLTAQLNSRKQIDLSVNELDPNRQHISWQNFGSTTPPPVKLDARAPEPAHALLQHLRNYEGRTLIAAESAGRREMLLDILRKHDMAAPSIDTWQSFVDGAMPLAITVSPIARGLQLKEPPITVLAEEQLFGERARQERRRRRADRDPEKIIRDLSDLTPGAPVVHDEYGVGRYLGLKTMEVGGLIGEFLMLEYADGDKIYVPVQSLDLVSRYTGAAADNAPLHKLGTDAWAKARKKAAQKVRDTAVELLDLYARRAARVGTALQSNEADLHAFESAFRFEETPDQSQAIAAVLDDMAAAKPMDRVVCGDVGFGKTEVALRAAFVAVQAGKQVAVLVPTTLLAQQHYQTFADRFADWPVRVESLSRFRSTAQVNEVIKGLESGAVDVVVGTHRLLQTQVQFKQLGLIVIDEEHRFGVKDKEKLKHMRAEVDVLTLTATPIPRTLNMAMGGLRDLSLITTPPTSRLAIKTFVSPFEGAAVREACLREIRRGGQIYYVHNSVETIEKTARMLGELVPEANIAIGHGQMRERELEQVMLDFYHQRCNLLVCTTIVESGIDVPTANTIVIDRADKFGLAQLHQMRGRVGRSHHQAYAYLLTPPRSVMTADAVKRLEAIESLEDLGAGFTLATHDLEIRGAGELLGDEQSGQIQEIGFAMYMEMLERAVDALKQGKIPNLDQPLHRGPEVDLHVPALLPEDYMPDVHMRLVLYKRIAAVESNEALRELQVEMIDRFGLLPVPAKNLFRIAEFKVQAKTLGIRKLDLHANGGQVTFAADAKLDPTSLILFVQRNMRTHRFDGPQKVRFVLPLENVEARFKAAEELLEGMSKPPPAVTAPIAVKSKRR
jgi:transcription-repair coupling factor (superfamily II helicase)